MEESRLSDFVSLSSLCDYLEHTEDSSRSNIHILAMKSWDQYRQQGSYEVRSPYIVDSGSDKVIFGNNDNLIIITNDGRYTTTAPQGVIDISVSDLIYVLTSDELIAYSVQGETAWRKEASEFYQLAASSHADIIGILSKKQLKTLDQKTGEVEYTLERERSGENDDILISLPAGFLITTWTFVTLISYQGDLVFDRNIGVVIRDVTHVKGDIVFAGEDENTYAYSSINGDKIWEKEINISEFLASPNNIARGKSVNKIVNLNDSGEIEEMDRTVDRPIYESNQNNIICTTNNKNQLKTHLKIEDKIRTQLITEKIFLGDEIKIKLINDTDTTKETNIRIRVEACVLKERNKEVEIKPNDDTVIEVTVSKFDSDGIKELQIFNRGNVIGNHELIIQDVAGSESNININTELIEITGDNAKIAVEINNSGKLPVEAAKIPDYDVEINSIDSKDKKSDTFTIKYEPRKNIHMDVEIRSGGQQFKTSSEFELPPLPSIDIEEQDSAVKMIMKNEYNVHFKDTLQLDFPGCDPITITVEIPQEGIKIIIPVFAEGMAEISLEGISVTKSIKLENGPEHGNNSNQIIEDSGKDVTKKNLQASHEPPRDVTIQKIQAKRSLVNGSLPGAGHITEEVVEIKNNNPNPCNICISSDEFSQNLGEFKPKEKKKILRLVSPVRIKEYTFEEASVMLGRSSQKQTLKQTDLYVSENKFSIWCVLNKDIGRMTAFVRNYLDFELKLRGVRFTNGKVRISEDIPAGDQREFVYEFEKDLIRESDTELVTFIADSSNLDQSAFKTLAKVVSNKVTPVYIDYKNIDIEITSDTRVVGRVGSVYLDIKNSHESPITDITVSAEGGAVDENFYTPTARERFNCDEKMSHTVDLEPNSKQIQFNLNIEYKRNGNSKLLHYTIRGSAVESEEDWDEKLVDEWKIEEREFNPQNALDLPEYMSTEYVEIEK